MKNALFTIGFILCLFPSMLLGQVGINTTSPDPSSSLDIVSTDSGILIPRMTEFQRNAIANPVKGLLIFQNNAEEGFWYFDGSIWILVGANGNANGEFLSESGVIHNTTNTAGDDFVVGSTSLNNIAGTSDNNRLYFDKQKAAFRAGSNTGTSWDNASLGSFSIATGLNTTASASYTVAMGLDSNASGTYSIAMGRGNDVSSEYGVAIGRSNTVTAQSGTSFGFSNDVTGDFATTLGRDNLASGTQAIAGGSNNRATGENSVALGLTSKSEGVNSIALGELNLAAGEKSVAMGSSNEALNVGSFALGNDNEVNGVNAMAYGNGLTAPSFSEVAVGIFNTRYIPNSITVSNDMDRVFSVGNGFRTGNASGVTTFSNALTILKNGNTGIGVEQPTEKLVVDGKIKATNVNFSGLPVFADEAAASSLDTGDLYQTPTGVIRIKL